MCINFHEGSNSDPFWKENAPFFCESMNHEDHEVSFSPWKPECTCVPRESSCAITRNILHVWYCNIIITPVNRPVLIFRLCTKLAVSYKSVETFIMFKIPYYMPIELKVDWSISVMWPWNKKWYCTAPVQYHFWQGKCCQFHLTQVIELTCSFCLISVMSVYIVSHAFIIFIIVDPIDNIWYIEFHVYIPSICDCKYSRCKCTYNGHSWFSSMFM